MTSFAAWTGRCRPETLVKDGPGWERWRLHNAANGLHLAESLTSTARGARRRRRSPTWPTRSRGRRAACCSTAPRLLEAGGFEFWRDLPPDAHGEDVHSQQQVMARRGAAGILPSGAYHQESPTALPDRGVSAVDAFPM